MLLFSRFLNNRGTPSVSPKVYTMYEEIKLQRFHIKRLNPKLFSAILILAKHCPKNWWNLSTSLKCFACIYYHWKKLVQSFYVKQRSLLSLHLVRTLRAYCPNTYTIHRRLLFLNTLSCHILCAVTFLRQPVFEFHYLWHLGRVGLWQSIS